MRDSRSELARSLGGIGKALDTFCPRLLRGWLVLVACFAVHHRRGPAAVFPSRVCAELGNNGARREVVRSKRSIDSLLGVDWTRSWA